MRAYSPSLKGMTFTAIREALVTVAYQDGAHCSDGFGNNDPKLKPGDPITVEAAFAQLKLNVQARADVVNRMLDVDVTQNQFDALVDLYYQNGNKPDKLGRPGFRTMMQLVNAGDFDAAHDYFEELHFNSFGQPSDGLKKRRKLEQAVFKDADYGDLTSVLRWDGDPRKTKPTVYHFQPEDLA